MDTSSWLQIEEHPDRNRILDALGRLLERGQIKAPPEVFKELKRVGVVEGWVKLHQSEIELNRNNDLDYLRKVGEVTHKFPGMVAARSNKEKADPYVVALAACGTPNPGPWIVVADETLKKRAGRKIPTACKAFGVDCFGFADMLRQEFPNDGW
ncbi:MAG: DUF4411 family protein [Croceibacterium sp.]